jgi:hypothetical protein
MKPKAADVLAIIAIIISISSVVVVYVQTNAVKEQLKITELQIRPYVRYVPEFRASPNYNKKKAVLVTMHEENLSPIPAEVFYTQLTPWINGVAGPWMHSPSRRVLYEHKDGASDLPLITGEMAQRIIDGRSELMVGTCVIYGSTAIDDDRRWEERALYSYESGTDLTATDLTRMIQYTAENEVSVSKTSCDSGNVRQEWSEQKIPVRHSNPDR